MTAVVLTPGHPAWPVQLMDLEKPPARLWALGDPALLARPLVAVVGTRRPTDYGRDVAEAAGRAFAEAGLVVVSGLAIGLDAAAQASALAVPGGATIAVLAGGVDTGYPAENAALYERIVRQGLVLSEYPPGAEPRRPLFPARNRIIAGLARCLLVVEGRRQSGTAHTVSWMLGLGGEVFAVPGRITDPQAEGPNAIIAQFGRIYREPADVIEWCHSAGAARRGPAEAAERQQLFNRAMKEPATRDMLLAAEIGALRRARLQGAEATVFDLLRDGPLDVDQLGQRSALAPGLLLAALSSLELQGLVLQRAGRRFQLAA